MPSVGIATTYVQTNRKKKRGIAINKRNIMVRDCFRCAYCYKEVTHTTGNIDHIIPKSLGGATSFENCICSCIDCNTKKANLSPSEAIAKGFKLHYKPRQISNSEKLEILIKSVTKVERKNFLDFLEENNLKLF
jgi:5-methylcytosine-specific restriction endonuclease McrA